MFTFKEEKEEKILIENFENKIEENSNNNTFDNDILGYIEIPAINLKKIIKKGNIEELLNQKYVVLLEGKNIESKNLVLAGHNISKVFKNIINLKINDEIIIHLQNETRYYNVKKLTKVDINNTNYFKETKEDILTLVTCTDNNRRRLLVICERK